ncbi:hypothetical protein NC980_00140 [Leptolyngbya sp. AS-A5]|nr:hypothetical protein [Leptolyngbya sp. FACHB-17]
MATTNAAQLKQAATGYTNTRICTVPFAIANSIPEAAKRSITNCHALNIPGYQ